VITRPLRGVLCVLGDFDREGRMVFVRDVTVVGMFAAAVFAAAVLVYGVVVGTALVGCVLDLGCSCAVCSALREW
jgi:hypothetical protein